MNVLITGTSSGLGDGLARYLASRKHSVAGISRSENKRLKTCNDYTHYSMDLTDFDRVREQLPEILQKHAPFDLVVLNAGVLGEIADMHQTSLEDLKRVMDINLWSNKLILDAIIDTNTDVKQIVGISSGAAVNGHRGWNAYAISKAAMNMMIQLYAHEMSDTHITALAPGLVDTSMQSYLTGLPEDERFPSLERLKAARGTDDMPRPLDLAPHLLEAMATLYKKYPSGAFADIRTMNE
jgi:NAD(P)-dependent dehydrogenase (short-subunit alcohol dehydrogenase family)